MKFKPLTILIIILCIALLPLIFVLIVTRLILDPPSTWWWFFGFLIVELIIGAIVGLVYLFIRISQTEEKVKGIDSKDSKERAVYEVKFDKYNPDNFIVEGERICNVGQPGTERTPIHHLWGKGTETNMKIDFLVNLKDSTKKRLVFSYLMDATDEKLKDVLRLMAVNPETEIKEEKTISSDEFGRPVTKITTKRISEQKKKEEEEKKQEELKSGI